MPIPTKMQLINKSPMPGNPKQRMILRKSPKNKKKKKRKRNKRKKKRKKMRKRKRKRKRKSRRKKKQKKQKRLKKRRKKRKLRRKRLRAKKRKKPNHLLLFQRKMLKINQVYIKKLVLQPPLPHQSQLLSKFPP